MYKSYDIAIKVFSANTRSSHNISNITSKAVWMYALFI